MEFSFKYLRELKRILRDFDIRIEGSSPLSIRGIVRVNGYEYKEYRKKLNELFEGFLDEQIQIRCKRDHDYVKYLKAMYKDAKRERLSVQSLNIIDRYPFSTYGEQNEHVHPDENWDIVRFYKFHIYEYGKFLKILLKSIKILSPTQYQSLKYKRRDDSRRLMEVHDLLYEEKFIEQDFHIFKAIFQEKPHEKLVNWCTNLNLLIDFIDRTKGLFELGDISNTERCVLFSNCFLHHGKQINAKQLGERHIPKQEKKRQVITKIVKILAKDI